MPTPTEAVSRFVVARGGLVLDTPAGADLPDLVVRTEDDVLVFVTITAADFTVTPEAVLQLRGAAVNWVADHMDELLWMPNDQASARTWLAEHAGDTRLIRCDAATVVDGGVTDYQAGVA
ncbi:Uncharacterised protein (plasmid) [Tsukamurella tyrosinosolvens]|uniref:Uncharacterized protein n=1 Tax=Tsukamurella tyrosinosolvens TaxID=57704 RepID=A0A1H4V4M3_TSUTY|nr:hypothetical protein [Tsukamurella tyrosinosolvens]KXO91051.1 hypothetical protein AXK58_21715 [Tsukamurella tyrosinosolvens]SEC75907.1 hypothetical protein SAMN04489793_3139 [Tsukamurella tyrosinosolvens]VEH90686.1 Uncharacterised protein [Tsukamurella tyrosinosolvens]